MILFISGPEILFIGLIILLVFGADKIPEIAKGLGKGIRQVKDATEDIKSEIKKSAENQGIDTDSIKKEIDDVKEKMDDLGGFYKKKSLNFPTNRYSISNREYYSFNSTIIINHIIKINKGFCCSIILLPFQVLFHSTKHYLK